MTATAPPGSRSAERWLHERARWARSGMLWLTGDPGAPPLWPKAGLFEALDETVGRIARTTTAAGRAVDLDVGRLLAGRGALMGLTRQGRTSAGGGCRLLAAADGWVAVSLARAEDANLVAAVVGWSNEESEATAEADEGPWAVLARAGRSWPGDELVARAQLVGIPAAVVPERPTMGGSAHRVIQRGRPATTGARHPLVIDLSSLWAGPLCAKVLGDSGARVVKVESRNRPDAGRAGCPAFFDWLHAGHQSVVLDFDDRGDLTVLRALIARADVVIEASRPRALSALGIDAERVVAGSPGMTWLSITGYGRRGDSAGRVAFGDDAAAGAGMVARRGDGSPVFCGDAVADPVTGIEAARAVLDSRARGGGELVEVAMVDAVASVMRPLPAGGVPTTGARSDPTGDDWRVDVGGRVVAVARPLALSGAGVARPLGADTGMVAAEVSGAGDR